MTLLDAVEASRRVAATRSRLEKVAVLADVLRRAAPDEVATVASLFARATEPERDFLARLVLGELRQGALEGVMLTRAWRTHRSALTSRRRDATQRAR